jgi:S-adenosylmethionine:tRNA ribosyltransferase-isomerase
MSLHTGDFDYHLPAELIARHPLPDRSASRMLVLDRARGTVSHRMFRELPGFVEDGDLLVFNDTKVIPARVVSDDGTIELLCLDRVSPCEWRCLVRPGRRMKPGRVLAAGGIRGEVTAVLENGDRMIRWEREPDLERVGSLALPHYMERQEEEADRSRYQTVFAREEGAVAAPTAGLHFTKEMTEALPHAFVTLHVGVGTFRPVRAERVEDHEMHSERFAVSPQTAASINAARRVLAVGTTVTRVLESLAPSRGDGERRIPGDGGTGETAIFIHPPYRFLAVDALLTNFHLPKSTLLMLVSAFAGREAVLEAYREAVAERYRFYSYGDCMLLL